MRERRAVRTISIWLVLIAGLFFAATCGAETLVWNASSGTVDGYIVYYGVDPSDRSNFLDVGNAKRLNIDTLPLSEGISYYLSVSAYNAVGESLPCKPLLFTPGDNTPPSPPVGLITE